MKVLLLISLDSAACDVQQWFSVRRKNVQARTAETTAIEAATYRYNQCSKTATVPVSQALEQERKMHALGTPSFRSEKRKMLLKSCLGKRRRSSLRKWSRWAIFRFSQKASFRLQTKFYFLFSPFKKDDPQSSPPWLSHPHFFLWKKTYISRLEPGGISPTFWEAL